MKATATPRIVQIGAVPPPYGGVSVHLSRLMERLRHEGLACQLIDISGISKQQDGVICLSWRKALMALLRHKSAIVHFHNFAPRNLYPYSILATRHRTVLSFHNERFAAEMKKYSAIEQGLFIRMLDNFDSIVVDSDANLELARSLGISDTKLLVIPEFLLPSSLPNSVQSLPQEISELRTKHRCMLATNAFSLAFYRGEDLYGIDLIIELMGRLGEKSDLDVAAVILLPNPDNPEYLARLQSRIRELSIQDRCLIVTTPLAETSLLWKNADVVIRATNTDGNSMSILEALACGTPVIASDCVERHRAVQLFENRNVDSLTTTTLQVLANLEHHRSMAKAAQLEDNGAKFVALYRRLLATFEFGTRPMEKS
ncbi:MAG: glycosyltransferase family 4 protein [Candidatus Zixiibacteriota bacterium]